MTARKPKPKPRKASGPTLMVRMETAEAFMGAHSEAINQLHQRIAALESRDRLRDKSHDEPVSNAGEAIGQHFRIIDESHTPWWRRFLNFMGAA